MGSGAAQAGPLLHIADGDARADAASRLKRFREQHPGIEISWRHPWEAAIPEPDGSMRFVVRWELHDLLDEVERRLAGQATRPDSEKTGPVTGSALVDQS